MNLFGNPYNLQGSSNPLQGSTQVLHGSSSALQGMGPVAPVAPVSSVQRYTAPKATPRVVIPAPAPIAADPLDAPLDAQRAGIAAGQPNSPWVLPTAQTTTPNIPLPGSPTASTPQVSSYIDPIRSYYEALNRTQPTEADNQMIKEGIRKDMQAQIDAINAQYANLISKQETANQDASGQTRAINARSGLMGSDFGVTNENKTKEYNAQQIKALEAEKNLMLTSVFQKIDERAKSEIQARKQEALGNQQAYLDYLNKSQQEARGEMTALAQKGVKLETLNPAQRKKLFEQAGYDEGWGELIYNAQKPKASQINYKFEKLGDGVGFFYGVDPETGELKQQKVNVDIPADFKLQITDDGTPLIFNPKTGEAQVASGFGEGQFRKPFASEMGGGGGGGSYTPPGQLSPQAQAVLNGTLKLEDLTPTVIGQISGELLQGGFQRTENVNAAQRESIDGYDLLKREAESAKAILETGLKTGLLDTAAGKVKSALGYGNNDFINYRSSIDNMGSSLLKLRSGAAVTPQEFDRIKGYIPQLTDDQKTAQTKITRFFEETTKAQENFVRRALQSEQSLQKEFSPSSSSVNLNDLF